MAAALMQPRLTRVKCRRRADRRVDPLRAQSELRRVSAGSAATITKIASMTKLYRTIPIALLLAVAPSLSVRSQTGTCGGPIAQTRHIVESDVATGNLNAPVGKRFSADLDRAAAACSAGHGGEALHMLAAAKARYGYR